MPAFGLSVTFIYPIPAENFNRKFSVAKDKHAAAQGLNFPLPFPFGFKHQSRTHAQVTHRLGQFGTSGRIERNPL